MTPEAVQDERYVFDACALIAYLNDENGAVIVADLLSRARNQQTQLYAAAVNVYELYYDCLKRDADTARQLLDDVYSLPISVVETFDRPMMQAAGDFKVAYRISLADSIALGLAQHLGAQVVSSDHLEFDPIDRDGKARFRWIR